MIHYRIRTQNGHAAYISKCPSCHLMRGMASEDRCLGILQNLAANPVYASGATVERYEAGTEGTCHCVAESQPAV